MLDENLKLAQFSFDSFTVDVIYYKDQGARGELNPALAAFDRIARGLSVNTDYYLDQRIACERAQKPRQRYTG